jgi:hypothetical protein
MVHFFELDFNEIGHLQNIFYTLYSTELDRLNAYISGTNPISQICKLIGRLKLNQPLIAAHGTVSQIS